MELKTKDTNDMKMSKTWRYIQRAEAQSDPKAARLSQYLVFDYMGSAEFEWGAVPNSLQFYRMLARAGVLRIHTAETHLHNGHPWYFLCPSAFDPKMVEAQIIKYATSHSDLKEQTRFDAHLYGSRFNRALNINLWFVLTADSNVQTNDNFVMWCTDLEALRNVHRELKTPARVKTPAPVKTPTPVKKTQAQLDQERADREAKVEAIISNLHIFDEVKIKLKNGLITCVTVVGIHPTTLDVKLNGGKRLTGIPHSALQV